MRILCRRALSLVALLAPLAAHAQTLRGVTVDASGQPVPGVVVMLLDSASRVAARAITSGTGEFRLTGAQAGAFRLRTLRIGFQPTTSEARTLVAGGEVSTRVVLSTIPVALDAVRTTGQSVCRAFSDSAAATFAVWEQIRAALTAAELTANARIIVATTLAYERTLENVPARSAEHVLRQSARISTGYVARPWHEVPIDSLHRAGYIVSEHDDVTAYNAPGLALLLSNVFIQDHCFRLKTDDASPGLLGIAFEPTPDRKKIAEIRGTLWVDRASAELRRLEFGYVNVSQEDQENARGGLEFQRARDGTWLVSRWSIRMPVFEQAALKAGEYRRSPKIAAIQVTGGEVAVARRGSDTLWTRPRFAVSGVIRDSVTASAVDGARISLLGTTFEGTTDAKGRFTLNNALPGEYTAAVQTRSLDSVNTVHRASILVLDSATSIELRVPSGQQFLAAVCGRSLRGSNAGVILGTTRLAGDTTSRAVLAGLRVVAEWGNDASDPTRLHRSETRAAADGTFRLCDVPLDAIVSVRASTDSAQTESPKLVRLSSAVRLTRADLVLSSTSALLARGATFLGVVVSDSSHLPIAGVEVTIPELDKSALTDSSGAFRIVGITPGEHRVLARRLGYGAADTKLTFTGFETVERRVVLGRAVTLEAVEVTARSNEREMPGFEDNKRIGLGKFMTRVELEKFTGMKLGTALDQLSGISTMRGYSSQLWVASRRQPPAACPPGKQTAICLQSAGYYLPDNGEASRGMKAACFAQVYIDRMLMNGVGEPTQPFDLSSVVPESVESVEWYPSAAETPLKYARLGSGCGVLVIWTRKGS